MLGRINWAACLPAAVVVSVVAIAAGILLDRTLAAADDTPHGNSAETLVLSPVATSGGRFEFVDMVAWRETVAATQPLTPEQCQLAASTVRTTGKTFREFIAAQGSVVVKQFEAEQAAAEGWVNAGCPPDPVRGGFMGANGTVQLKPYARQSFSAAGDGSGGTYVVISER